MDDRREASLAPSTGGRESPDPQAGIDAASPDRIFRAAFENAFAALWILDDGGRCLEVNAAACALCGARREQLVGASIGAFGSHDPDGVDPWASFQATGKTRGAGSWRRPDGTTRNVEFEFMPHFLPGRHHVVILDVTERMHMEEALRRSEERFSRVFRSSPAAIGIATLDDGRLIDVNDGFLEMFGYAREETIGRTVHELGVWADPARRRDVVRRLREDGSLRDVEGRGRRKSGEVFDTQFSMELVEVAGEHVLVSTITDVTDRRRIERALRASEENYRRLVEYSQDAILVQSRGKVAFLNSAGARLLGAERPGEIEGRDVLSLVRPDYRDLVVDRIRREMLTGAPVSYVEQVWIRLDGSPVDVEVGAMPFLYHGEPATHVVARDITDRKRAAAERQRLEDQLRQSQKLEAIGQLAGGVAHDFNNLLTAIQGYSQLLIRGTAPEDPRQAELQEIGKAAQRAAVLTRQLLAFSRRQVLVPEVLDPGAVVSELASMLHRVIGEDIELVADAQPGASRVRVDRGQFEQVIMNLAINARDAMPGGGKLVLQTRDVELRERESPDEPCVEPGRYVLITVSDTGHGMDEATKGRIFEPFFTTKDPGRGTGLGLATVYGIVRQSGGRITVESAPGRGATFRVYLPAVEAGSGAARDPAREAPPAGGTETILVVEDEPLVRGLTGDILRGHGYRVLEAADGQAALRVMADRRGSIDLLLTDVVMPGMSGRELAERLATTAPGLRVLFTSGYADDEILRRGRLADRTALLEKPFTPDALASKVREALDHPARNVGRAVAGDR